MARIRTIKPEFWEDEKIGRLPIPCRLFFIGCWNFADDYGVIKGNPALLKSQIFPYDENLRVSEVKKWLNALVEARMLIPIILDDANKRLAEESYYVIRTFRSHQVLDKRFTKSYLGKDEKFVNSLIDKALSNYHVNTSCTPREHVVNTSEEKEEEKERNKKGTNVPKEDAATAATLSRKEKFGKSLIPYVEKYGKDMVRDFFDYWTEMNQSKSKMRFEQQPTWETSKRLATWAKRDKNYADNTKGHEDRRRGYDVAATGEKDYGYWRERLQFLVLGSMSQKHRLTTCSLRHTRRKWRAAIGCSS